PFVATADMPELYATHDIFLFPSLMEGMPISLLEAIASGLPVVTTETCGMMDLIEDGYNGLLAKPADARGFAPKVDTRIDSPALREHLGRKAQETAHRYTWDLLGKKYSAVLELAAQSTQP